MYLSQEAEKLYPFEGHLPEKELALQGFVWADLSLFG